MPVPCRSPKCSALPAMTLSIVDNQGASFVSDGRMILPVVIFKPFCDYNPAAKIWPTEPDRFHYYGPILHIGPRFRFPLNLSETKKVVQCRFSGWVNPLPCTYKRKDCVCFYLIKIYTSFRYLRGLSCGM